MSFENYPLLLKDACIQRSERVSKEIYHTDIESTKYQYPRARMPATITEIAIEKQWRVSARFIRTAFSSFQRIVRYIQYGYNIITLRVVCHTLLRVRGGIVGVNGQLARLIRSAHLISARAEQTHTAHTRHWSRPGNTSRLRFSNNYISKQPEEYLGEPPERPEEEREDTHSECEASRMTLLYGARWRIYQNGNLNGRSRPWTSDF